MWSKWVRPATRATIHSGFLVQVLRRGGARHHCDNCGERMFVKYASGLCPLCYNGRRELRRKEPLRAVRDELVLAGVFDDPAIEWIPERGETAPNE